MQIVALISAPGSAPRVETISLDDARARGWVSGRTEYPTEWSGYVTSWAVRVQSRAELERLPTAVRITKGPGDFSIVAFLFVEADGAPETLPGVGRGLLMGLAIEDTADGWAIYAPPRRQSARDKGLSRPADPMR